MATATPDTSAAGSASGYMTVQVGMLRRLPHATVDLFIPYKPGYDPTLFYRAGCPFEPGQVEGLLNSDVLNVLVRAEEFHQFASHLLDTVDAQAEYTDVPPVERYAALQLAMAVEIEHAARLLDCGPYIAVADKLGRDLSQMLVNNSVVPRDLYQLARHDFLTFTHITNVASYSVILAEHLGICEGNEFESLAKAAILHDIGKRFIPASILQKPTKPTAAERAIIETHPQRGYEELYGRDDITHDQLMVVYQHHERFDGKGYPVGSIGEEIHPWARMLAVVDVFDAMTGKRPYRRPATAADAMAYINKNSGTHFDPEMAACWNSIMAKA